MSSKTKTPTAKRFDSATVRNAEKLAEQLNQLVVDLTKTPAASYRDLALIAKTPVESTFPVALAHGMPSVPKGLEVIDAKDKTDGSVFTSPPFVSWAAAGDGKNLLLRHITGLTAGHVYSFRFRVSA